MRLDVAIGRLEVVASLEAQFRELAEAAENRGKWFAESDEKAFWAKGIIPKEAQCIAFDVPPVFAYTGKPRTACIADIYEHVSFLGHLNRQIADVPAADRSH